MPELAVATVVAKNYVSFARVLAESFLRQHPDIPFFALLSDEVDGHFDPAAEPFRLVRQDELGIPDLPRLRARYDRRQIAVASKPYLLSHLLDRGFGARSSSIRTSGCWVAWTISFRACASTRWFSCLICSRRCRARTASSGS